MSLPGPIFHSSKATQITIKPQDVPRGFRVVVVRLGRGHRAGGWGSGGRGLPPAAVTNNRAPPLPEPLRPLGEPAVKRSLQKQGLCFTLNLYIRDSWSRQQHWDTAAAPAAHGTSANELPVPNWCRSWGVTYSLSPGDVRRAPPSPLLCCGDAHGVLHRLQVEE